MAFGSYTRSGDDGSVAGRMSKGTGIPLALRGTQARADPTDRPWERPTIGRRHCWVTPTGLSRREALMLDWNRTETTWLGLVSYLDDQSHHITEWIPASRISPAG